MDHVVTLSELRAMSNDEKWSLIDHNARPSRSVAGQSKCKPNWIGGLYRNIPMPHQTFQDGTSIELDEVNIYNGTLTEQDAFDKVAMQWSGYTCQLYDGTLKMCPIGSDSTITGECNGVQFKFEGSYLAHGVWPGFLELFIPSK